VNCSPETFSGFHQQYKEQESEGKPQFKRKKCESKISLMLQNNNIYDKSGLIDNNDNVALDEEYIL
jgi:hypothetical protein